MAVCDVDRKHAESGKEKAGGKADVYEDYRKLLDRKDIDVVTIVTPDHWHTKIAIDAMRAGKDVYCEKPLTLTIDEGKQICKVLKETGRVFQVGTQQRSEMDQRFLKAIAMVRDGRIGKVHKATCAIGGAPDRRAVRSRCRCRRSSTGTCGSARRRWSTTPRSAATTSSAGGTNTPAAR